MKHFFRKLASILMAASLVATMGLTTAFASTPPTGQEKVYNGFSSDQNQYEIYPVPHSITYEGPDDAHQAFTMTEKVNVVFESGIDQPTRNFLNEILTANGVTYTKSEAPVEAQTNILLGVHESNGVVDKYMQNIGYSNDLFKFNKNDAYVLSASTTREAKGTIAILGKDTDSTYYGLATLKMMFSSFSGRRFLSAKIEDYSDVKLRGFIEGFYGGFDYEGRESQMRSIRDVKGNMYVFASKTDPYHGGDKWADLYPNDELSKIKHLVDVGKEMKVRYVWSVHIGQTHFFQNVSTDPSDAEAYQRYEEQLKKLEKKFDQLYSIGVRDFHVLNDDSNSGTYEDVVKLLNDLDDWLKQKGDCGPLVYCPNGYNESWSESQSPDELPAFKALHDDIYLYWTGSEVNSPITQENVQYPYTKSNHYPVTWLNYPCSEHDKAGIYLGDISHYISNADGVTGQMGLMSNPVNYPEANKVAYFQLCSWAWNHDNYTSYQEKLWEDSFKYLQPEVYDSYLTIARNVSNCPNSTRVSSFPESEYLKNKLDSVQAKALAGTSLSGDKEVEALQTEFTHIQASISDFCENCNNRALVTELTPWLNSLEQVTQACQSALEGILAVQTGDSDTAESCYNTATAALSKWATYPTPQYDTVMAKSGSLRLQPFAEKLTEYIKNSALGLTNLALNKPVEVSGLEIADGKWTGDKAVDGDKTNNDSRWSSGIMKNG